MQSTPKENNDKLSFKTEVDAPKYNQEKYTIMEMFYVLGTDIDNAAELSDSIEMLEEEDKTLHQHAPQQ